MAASQEQNLAGHLEQSFRGTAAPSLQGDFTPHSGQASCRTHTCAAAPGQHLQPATQLLAPHRPWLLRGCQKQRGEQVGSKPAGHLHQGF